MSYIPGKGTYDLARRLKESVDGTLDPTPISRRSILAAPFELLGAAGVAAGIREGVEYWQRQRADEAERRALTTLAEQIGKSTKMSQQAAEDALLRIRYNGWDAAHIIDGKAVSARIPTSDDEFETAVREYTICKTDARFLTPLYSDLSAEDTALIKENTKYIIFANELTRDLGFTKEEVAGLSVAHGGILISTGTLYRPDLPILRTISAHEACHHKYRTECAAKRTRVVTLHSELASMDQELTTTDDQIARQKSKGMTFYLEAARAGTIERIRTAEYLAGKEFGNTFVHVYPHNVILSKDLLAGDVDPAALKRVIENKPSIHDPYEELHHAAKALQVVRTRPRDAAIRELYAIAGEPNPDGLAFLNAAYALLSLSPKSFTIKPEGSAAHPRGQKAIIVPSGMSEEQIYTRRLDKDLIPDEDDERARKIWQERQDRFRESTIAQHRRSGSRGALLLDVPTWRRTSRFVAYGTMPSLDRLLANQ